MDSHQTKSMSEDDFLGNGTSRNQADDNAAILPIELTNSTGKCLENLNDDCLLEIFSCNSLTLIDLCSMAETCTRFKKIIERVFPKDYRIVCELYCFGYEFRSKNCKAPLITPQIIERILKHFGQRLSELSISSDYQNIVNSVQKYCGDATIKNLEIYKIENLDDIVNPMDPILQRLQKLTFDECSFIRTVSRVNLNCSSLVELKINRSSGCVDIMECTFPNLQHFTWKCSLMYAEDSITNCDILHKFIRRHDHLKSVRISVCCNELLNVIDNHCKELQELILNDMKEYKPSTPGCLAKLKILELDYLRRSSSPLEYIPLLTVAKSLEIMRMSCSVDYEIPDQTVDVLSQLENLREFHFTHGSVNFIPWTKFAQLRKVKLDFCNCDRYDIINMIENLINLEELEFKGRRPLLGRFGYYLSKKDFLEICKMFERREHVLTIKCNFPLELKKYCDNYRWVKLINV